MKNLQNELIEFVEKCSDTSGGFHLIEPELDEFARKYNLTNKTSVLHDPLKIKEHCDCNLKQNYNIIIIEFKEKDDPREQLRFLAERWNASGEFDDTEFVGRYFLNDTDLDEFARKHGLTLNDGTEDQDNHDPVKIMKFYDCELIYDYVGSNPNRQFGDVEIVFNEANE